ncbi:carbohydrate kinase family protein [Microbacterium sp. NIBRBAC000506063]|uniref:carbohydrate kinase family protein n=1 Tax=Microbacterium sp. NIBRBAC000506063 TaxID=2734618 RepID=UPI001BB5BB43|nr:PfkB family carbohydrate kinase [Microbacterium sp. NIBRBAC000506063]QTV80084.1 hypothetical protein KAE78_03005 [Microbacterium sp. NIBRBAC000506063]
MTNAQITGIRPPIVVIGDALIDEIRGDGGVRELVGGAALNVAVGLRRLGHPATLIAMVGSDAAGDRIRTYLADHGVELIESAAPRGSSRAIVTRAENGEPSYEFNRAAQERSIRYSADAREAIIRAPLVVVSCFPFDVPSEVEALREAVGEVPLAIDPNPRTGMMRDRAAFVVGFESVVPAALVKVGADDADVLYDGDLSALRGRLRALGASAVLATEGAQGASIESDAGFVRAPIAQQAGPVVDTVGAGDATLAALAAGFVEQEPSDAAGWQELLDRAMAVAAATCRGEGGLLRTPESLGGAGYDRIGT